MGSEWEIQDMEKVLAENQLKIKNMEDSVDKLKAMKKPDKKRKTSKRRKKTRNKRRNKTRNKKEKCCKCHYIKKNGKLRKVRGPYGHCSYDSLNCCKDKKTIKNK